MLNLYTFRQTKTGRIVSFRGFSQDNAKDRFEEVHGFRPGPALIVSPAPDILAEVMGEAYARRAANNND